MLTKKQVIENKEASIKQQSQTNTKNIETPKHRNSIIPQVSLDQYTPITRDILQLQRAIGNQAVGKLILQRIQRQSNQEEHLIQRNNNEINIIQREPLSLNDFKKNFKDRAIREDNWNPSYENQLSLFFGFFEKKLDKLNGDSEQEIETTIRDLIDQYIINQGIHPEGDKTTKIILFMLSGKISPPSPGSLGKLRIENTELVERPIFSYKTQAAMPLKRGEHRRHVTAWHNIRAYLNKAYKDHKNQIIPYLNTLVNNQDKDTIDEVNESIKKKPNSHINGGPSKSVDEDHGKTLLAAAYVMNSSTKNLWVGDGVENQEINFFSNRLQDLKGTTKDYSHLAALVTTLPNYDFTSPRVVELTGKIVDKVKQYIRSIDELKQQKQLEQTKKVILLFQEYIIKECLPVLEIDSPDDMMHESNTHGGVEVKNLIYNTLFILPQQKIEIKDFEKVIKFFMP